MERVFSRVEVLLHDGVRTEPEAIAAQVLQADLGFPMKFDGIGLAIPIFESGLLFVSLEVEKGVHIYLKEYF